MRRFLSYRNQFIDLFWKSMDCILYNWDLHHERIKTFCIHTHRVCFYMLKSIICYFCFSFFFLSGFSLTNIHDSQGNRWKGKLSSYILSTTSTRFTDTKALSGLLLRGTAMCIAGNRNRTWNLWYTLFRIPSFYTCTGSSGC